MEWNEKLKKLKDVAKEVDGRFWVEEFPDGNKRARVEVRLGERKRTNEDKH